MPLVLNESDREQFENRMYGAFTGKGGADRLDGFAFQTLRIRIYDEFEEGGTKAYVNQLLTYAQKHGDTDKLIDLLIVQRPGDPLLRAFIARIRPEALQRVSEDDHLKALAELTRDGLIGLRDLTADPAIAALIAAARLDLRSVSTDLELLAGYKDLHDTLHQIQVLLFKAIGNALKAFPMEAASIGELTIHAMSLAERASGAVKTVAAFRDRKKAKGEEGWTNSLAGTAAALKGAIAAGEKPAADRALLNVKLILRSQPPRLNGLLVQTAREIPTDQLVQVLQTVAGRLQDPAERQPLQDAAAALESLAEDVRRRVEEHEAWQQVEANFWLTEDAMLSNPPAIEELNALWPMLVERVAAIEQLAPGPWSVELNSYAEAFIKVCPIPATPPVHPAARSAMEVYVYGGRIQFSLVDQALKERCLNVATLSRPLGSLMSNG